jgi:hypothetical protein
MTIRLNGSTSGYTEIDAPASAANNTLVLPTGNGSAGNILGTDGAGNLSWVNGRMVLATAQNSTSGTSIDFTGIPSWVKRVTVMFSGVSSSGSSVVQVQIGSGSVDTTGYTVTAAYVKNAAASLSTTYSSGAGTIFAIATSVRSGQIVFASLGSNIWSVSGNIGDSSDSSVVFLGGNKTLSGTLDRIRITTVNGTDTFDAGSINILYEG